VKGIVGFSAKASRSITSGKTPLHFTPGGDAIAAHPFTTFGILPKVH